MSREVTPRTRGNTPRDAVFMASSAQGEALLSQVKNIDHQLKELRRQPGGQPADAQDALRASLKQYCCELIAEEPELAHAHDIEHVLWKSCFYRKIEDHRAAMRKAKQQQQQQSSSSSSSGSGSGSGSGVVMPERTRRSLHAFLTQSRGFYETLLLQYLDVAKIQLVDSRFIDSWDGTDYSIRRHMYLGLLTAHRCLVFLGDIERYFQYCEKDSRTSSSSSSSSGGAGAGTGASSPRVHLETSRQFYWLALELVPENGNPHNQLAVLATAGNDDLRAVYHYFRSLGVEQPFGTARQNLRLIFLKNEQMVSKHFVDEDGHARQQPTRRKARAFLSAMHTRMFAMLYGCDVDMFGQMEQMLSIIRPRLSALLCDATTSDDEREQFVMRVLVCCIFTVHTHGRQQDGDVEQQRFVSSPSLPAIANANPTATTTSSATTTGTGGGGGGGGGGGEDSNFESARCRLALTWLFEVAAATARAVDSQSSCLLSGVGVVCDWLSLHPEYVKQHVPPGTDDRVVFLEASARQVWCLEMVRLVNRHPEQAMVLTTDPSPQPLPEELDLRNFVYINHTYTQYDARFLLRRDPANPQAKHSPRTPSHSVLPALGAHSAFSKRWYKVHSFVRDHAVTRGLMERTAPDRWSVMRRTSADSLLITDTEGSTNAGADVGAGATQSFTMPPPPPPPPSSSSLPTSMSTTAATATAPSFMAAMMATAATTTTPVPRVSFLVGQDSIWGAPTTTGALSSSPPPSSSLPSPRGAVGDAAAAAAAAVSSTLVHSPRNMSIHHHTGMGDGDGDGGVSWVNSGSSGAYPSSMLANTAFGAVRPPVHQQQSHWPQQQHQHHQIWEQRRSMRASTTDSSGGGSGDSISAIAIANASGGGGGGSGADTDARGISSDDSMVEPAWLSDATFNFLRDDYTE